MDQSQCTKQAHFNRLQCRVYTPACHVPRVDDWHGHVARQEIGEVSELTPIATFDLIMKAAPKAHGINTASQASWLTNLGHYPRHHW